MSNPAGESSDGGLQPDFERRLDDDSQGTVTVSKELVVKQVYLASAFVMPFAAAVASELEEFGLTKHTD